MYCPTSIYQELEMQTCCEWLSGGIHQNLVSTNYWKRIYPMFVLKWKDAVLVGKENEKNGCEFKQLESHAVSFCYTNSIREHTMFTDTLSMNNDDHVYRMNRIDWTSLLFIANVTGDTMTGGYWTINTANGAKYWVFRFLLILSITPVRRIPYNSWIHHSRCNET